MSSSELLIIFWNLFDDWEKINMSYQQNVKTILLIYQFLSICFVRMFFKTNGSPLTCLSLLFSLFVPKSTFLHYAPKVSAHNANSRRPKFALEELITILIEEND